MNRKDCSVVSSMAALCGVLVLTLSGCVTSEPVALPDGSEGLAIDCSRGGNIADCMNYAAEVCGGPYRVFGQENHSTPVATESAGMISVTNSVDRVLIVQCGAEEKKP